MANTRQMVSTVSIAPATYIHVAGGLNLAALKKLSVAGSVNLPTMCGMKNSPQIRRSTLTPSVRSKFCAQPDMVPPLPFVDAIVYFDRSRESADPLAPLGSTGR